MGVRSEFAQLAYVAYLCAIRVPSEASPLRMTLRSGELIDFAVHRDQGLIGVRYIADAPFLATRLKKRKNLRGWAIFLFPRFCPLGNRNANGLFPVLLICPQICARVRPGEIFPHYKHRNIRRIRRKVLGIIKIADAERYSSHASRRWAALGAQRDRFAIVSSGRPRGMGIISL